MESRPREFVLTVRGVDGKLWDSTIPRERASDSITLQVPADRVAKSEIYLAAPETAEAKGRDDIIFTVRATDDDGGESIEPSFFEWPED